MKKLYKILTVLILLFLLIMLFFGRYVQNVLLFKTIFFAVVIVRIIVSFICVKQERKLEEEELKQLKEERDILLKKSEYNYSQLKQMMKALADVIECKVSFYEAQKFYFKLNQHITNAQVVLEESKRKELNSDLKELEKEMLNLPLIR